MIQRLQISGVHMHVGDRLQKYVVRKIGRLDRFLAKQQRADLLVEVRLQEGKQDRTCHVIIHLPQATVTAEETTINMFAAVDIVETKLRIALKKYKELHGNPRLRQRLIAKLKHRVA